MMSTGLSLDTIDQLTNGRLGVHDVPCPLCGPFKSHRGQRRDVLRVWRVEPGFSTFHFARCGEAGYCPGFGAPPPGPTRPGPPETPTPPAPPDPTPARWS